MKSETLVSRRQAGLQPFLRWTARGMIAAGLVLLGFVVLVGLHATLYQAKAERFLESQVRRGAERNATRSATAVADGDVLGRIDILRLGVSVAVLQGTSSSILRLGAGHIASTSLPGESGNSAIAGHRDTFFRG